MKAFREGTVSQRDHNAQMAKALADGIQDVAAELRLVDVADFVTYIHLEQFANIQDIVNSSIELYFKQGTLIYGWAAEFELDWTNAPAISLNMEFRHRDIWIVFKLTLRAAQTSVNIHCISLGRTSGNYPEDTACLIEAIADARLPPIGK
jgi:hypothetical protein